MLGRSAFESGHVRRGRCRAGARRSWPERVAEQRTTAACWCRSQPGRRPRAGAGPRAGRSRSVRRWTAGPRYGVMCAASRAPGASAPVIAHAVSRRSAPQFGTCPALPESRARQSARRRRSAVSPGRTRRHPPRRCPEQRLLRLRVGCVRVDAIDDRLKGLVRDRAARREETAVECCLVAARTQASISSSLSSPEGVSAEGDQHRLKEVGPDGAAVARREVGDGQRGRRARAIRGRSGYSAPYCLATVGPSVRC